MDINRIIIETINSLKGMADPGRGKFSDWYFPTSMDVIGVKSAELKAVTRNLKQALREYDFREIIELCIEMSGCGIFDNDNRLAARVKREVTRKLITGRKNG